MRPSSGSVTGHEPAAGMLLLAGARLDGPPFAGTVVLLLDHDGGGSLGVVLNRPTDTVLERALPADSLAGFGAAAAAVGSSPVMEGGPVDPSQLLALVSWHPGWTPRGDRLREVLPGTGLADLLGLAVSGEGARDPGWREARVRAYVGYAGWGPGQLQREVDEEAWYVLPGMPGDPFTARPEGLWSEVVERQPGTAAWLGWRPSEVTHN